MNYYLITYSLYGKKEKATETFKDLKKEAAAWDCFRGNKNCMKDLINFKYENVVSIVKTTSFKKYIDFV